MTRRIKKDLKEFFDKQPLTDSEKSFIIGCMSTQIEYPQLTNRQWEIICDIEKRYKNGDNQRHKKTS